MSLPPCPRLAPANGLSAKKKAAGTPTRVCGPRGGPLWQGAPVAVRALHCAAQVAQEAAGKAGLTEDVKTMPSLAKEGEGAPPKKVAFENAVDAAVYVLASDDPGMIGMPLETLYKRAVELGYNASEYQFQRALSRHAEEAQTKRIVRKPLGWYAQPGAYDKELTASKEKDKDKARARRPRPVDQPRPKSTRLAAAAAAQRAAPPVPPASSPLPLAPPPPGAGQHVVHIHVAAGATVHVHYH